jgi:hypothetical protein
MFCSIQNSEQVLFWHKFDFYSNFGSNLKKSQSREVAIEAAGRLGTSQAGPPEGMKAGARGH